MSFFQRINSTHLDILKEIGNIGAGHSATALSKLLHRKIDMQVPNVRIVSFDEMMEFAGGAENIVAGIFLRIEGDLTGNMFFILQLPQATTLIQDVIGDKNFSFASDSQNEMGISAFQEVGNILSGSYLTSLSDFTGLNLYPSVPGFSIDMVGAIIGYGLLELSQVSDFAIVIETEIKENENPDNNNINGHFLLLPDPDSFEKIFTALGVQIHD
ncbi:chemotaxis protein CheC [Fredinandcohnia sp. QZ13]|uniref:chemotaxis protein CheC n=1 Tax=Fredinandcohnia sp. QZ13 TaxID=3073144 RepID=UPI00285356F3|nr:chemotaxis protein CheC [Fredinandcohnia sp. QZ13]MDR4886476.1 chemotaxis protein CheC [Fredinandcohnia sp. QZ13]